MSVSFSLKTKHTWDFKRSVGGKVGGMLAVFWAGNSV